MNPTQARALHRDHLYATLRPYLDDPYRSARVDATLAAERLIPIVLAGLLSPDDAATALARHAPPLLQPITGRTVRATLRDAIDNHARQQSIAAVDIRRTLAPLLAARAPISTVRHRAAVANGGVLPADAVTAIVDEELAWWIRRTEA